MNLVFFCRLQPSKATLVKHFTHNVPNYNRYMEFYCINKFLVPSWFPTPTPCSSASSSSSFSNQHHPLTASVPLIVCNIGCIVIAQSLTYWQSKPSTFKRSEVEMNDRHVKLNDVVPKTKSKGAITIRSVRKAISEPPPRPGKSRPNTMLVECLDRTFRMQAGSWEEVSNWITAIVTVMEFVIYRSTAHSWPIFLSFFEFFIFCEKKKRS